MSHFAKINPETMVVEIVLVGRDDDNEVELSERTGDLYKQTSYNTKGGVYYNPETGLPDEDQSKAFRGTFAGIGFVYDPVADVFVAPTVASDYDPGLNGEV